MNPLTKKLRLMTPCLLVAGSLIENLPDDLTVDPEGVDPKVQKTNEMALRVARTFYAWLCQSALDTAVWATPPEGVSQLELFEASARMTASIFSNAPDTVPLDTTTLDPAVIQNGAAVWRVWRTCYGWLVLSLGDATMWPEPPEGVVSEESEGDGGMTLDGLKNLLPDALKDPTLIGLVKAAFLAGS